MGRAPAVMRLIDRLRFRWWEWADARNHPRQRLPTIIELSVNDVCNSQCQMCHIWQQKRDHEITAGELSTILSNPLFREARDVVINGGEPTLREDLPELAQAILTKLPRLRGLSLITNAIEERRVVQSIEAVGLHCRDAGIPLYVMVSIDGVGDVHDRIRGVPGNFASADRVIDKLAASPFVKACLIGCTLIRENIYDAERVLLYARSKSVYARFRLGIPHRRLYSADLTCPFDLDESQRYHLACFLDELRFHYETTPGRRAFYLSLRNQIMYGAPRTTGCVWKGRGITLTSRGELAYCAVESPTLGGLLQERGDDLYWQKASVLRDIVENRCPHCKHDYDGLRHRRILIERMIRNSVRRLPKGKDLFDFARTVKSTCQDLSADRHARHASVLSSFSSKRATPRNAILLCGEYGAESLGDKAALAGLVLSLRAAGWQGPVDLASSEPFVSRETARQLPELGLRRVETVDSARAHLSQGKYRLVAVAGGPLSSARAEVFDLLSLFTEAEAGRTARAVMGCAVGPLGHSKRRNAAIRRIFELSQQTVIRDQASLALARTDLKIPGSASVLPDPAFIWAVRQAGASDMLPGRGPVLLALREIHAREFDSSGSSRNGELKSEFEHELIEFVKEMQRSVPAWKLRLLATNTHPRDWDDRLFFHRLFAAYPDLLARLCWKRATPAEDFAAIRGARAVVAMRFHSALFATAAGVPHVVIGSPALPLENFSGRKCAAKLIEIVGSSPPQAPCGVEEAYASAWQQALAAAA
jgi:MoaA/NifB/PqqE/SkfB family radical SAM enzyme/polysaccharide pyruvyl transferase WcaK-like protein